MKSYIIFNTILNRVQYKIEVEKYTDLVLSDNEIAIGCEENADVNDSERWKREARDYQGPSYGDKIDIITDLIQQRLDNFARSEGRNYDNMLSACTYVFTDHPIYSIEGKYCVKMRSETWNKAYQILNDFQNGLIPEPTWEEIEAQLPELKWPVIE